MFFPVVNQDHTLFKGRTSGRLSAVQALFQIEQSENSASAVALEFLTLRLKDKRALSKTNTAFFTTLVEGAWRRHAQSDEMISGALNSGWTLERIEPVTRAILRAALYELCETDTPPAVVIDEYLNITHNFFDKSEVSFVRASNSVLLSLYSPGINIIDLGISL